MPETRWQALPEGSRTAGEVDGGSWLRPIGHMTETGRWHRSGTGDPAASRKSRTQSYAMSRLAAGSREACALPPPRFPWMPAAQAFTHSPVRGSSSPVPRGVIPTGANGFGRRPVGPAYTGPASTDQVNRLVSVGGCPVGADVRIPVVRGSVSPPSFFFFVVAKPVEDIQPIEQPAPLALCFGLRLDGRSFLGHGFDIVVIEPAEDVNQPQ